LNLKKSELFGRKIYKDAVSFHPASLKGLSEFPQLETAKQLQHLLSALNWMRSTIPAHLRNVALLQELL
jgi:hypothetical protein